ncbi:hypothetical protein D0Z07_8385 [Hyphodiscus hymeniophilus]|uniref:Uncharacterized protein n=1 Tax=Hyphodiscus hymeniophilus TaxID=353542 RepID=A0A9P6SR20_9HELO|nr:hypothetical protein D0Z07_8385 [Hyphodiscus hymeniophilus]
MASEHVNGTYIRVPQLGGVPRKTSEDKLYEISDLIVRNPFVTPSQPRGRTLKTYASRFGPTIKTSLNEQLLRARISTSIHDKNSSETSRHHTAPAAEMVVDAQVEAYPSPAPLKNKVEPKKKRLQGTRCTVSKEDLERAIAVTPVTNRGNRRRLAAGLPSRLSRWPARTPRAQLQDISRSSTGLQLTSNVLLAEQKGDSHGSASSGDCVIFDKAVQKAQQPNDEQDVRKLVIRDETRDERAQKQTNQRCGSNDSKSRAESVNVVDFTTVAEQNPRLVQDTQPKNTISGANIFRDGEPSKIFERERGIEEPAHYGRNDDENKEDQQFHITGEEMLPLGHDAVSAKPADGDNSSARSPKRRCPTPDFESPDNSELHNSVDETENEEVERAGLRKKRRTSRQNFKKQALGELLQDNEDRRMSKETRHAFTKVKSKPLKLTRSKKKARSRPTGELVIVSERVEDLDTEASEPAELAEDPISQLTVSFENIHTEANGKKSSHKLKSTLRSHKTFGPIDLSDFRMPKARPGPRQPAQSHSDGFVGHEAQPIGNLMPLRMNIRRQKVYNRITVWLGELQLVAERYEDTQNQNPIPVAKENFEEPHCSNKDNNPGCLFSKPTRAELVREIDPMLIDPAEEQPLLEVAVDEEAPQRAQGRGEHATPQISPKRTRITEPRSRNSPLEQKEQRKRTVSFKETNDYISQALSTQSGGPFGRHENNEPSVSQQLKMVSKPAPKPKKKELDVPLQLMMVSIPISSVRSSCSDDNHSEEDTEDENEGSSDDEDERSDSPEEDSGGEGHTQCEVGVEEEDVEIVNQEDFHPGSSEALEHIGLPFPSNTDGRVYQRKPLVPTLPGEDAHNSISRMSSKQGPNRREAPLEDVSGRRSLILHQAQEPQLDQPLLDIIDKTVIDRPWEKERHEHRQRRFSKRDSYIADFWRPREQKASSLLTEVENDEIVDCPTPAESEKSPNLKRKLSRKISRSASQALQIVGTRPPSPHPQIRLDRESQGSVELGDTQVLLGASPGTCVAETQLSNPNQGLEHLHEGMQDEADEEYDDKQVEVGSWSQETFTLGSNYFQRASEDLVNPDRRAKILRTRSMPASVQTSRAQAKGEFKHGGVTMTAAFKYTISPSSRMTSSSGVGDTMLSGTPRAEKTLSELTRRASKDLGTVPSSERKRMVSLPFHPPFQKLQNERESLKDVMKVEVL